MRVTVLSMVALGAVVGITAFAAMGSTAAPSDSTITFNLECLKGHIGTPEVGMDMARDCVTQVNHHGHIFSKAFAQALVGRHPVAGPSSRAASPQMKTFFDNWTKSPTSWGGLSTGVGKDLDKMGPALGQSFTGGIEKAQTTLDVWSAKYDDIAQGITTGYRDLGQGIFGAPGDESNVDQQWGMYGRGNWWFKNDEKSINVPGWLDTGDDLRQRFKAFNPALQEDNIAKGWPTKAEPEKLEGDKSVAGRFGLYSYFRTDPEEVKKEIADKKKIVETDQGLELPQKDPFGLKYKKIQFPPADPKKK